jgi:general secretion pathway protein F
MPSFRYKAIAVSGRVEAGSIEAVDQMAAISDLRAKGYLPIEANIAQAPFWARLLPPNLRESRISARQLGMTLQELAVLLQAGLPLDRALELLANEPAVKRFQPALKSILADVRKGAALAEAFAAHRRILSPSIVTLVEAGEAGATLDSSLVRAADMLLRAAALRETIVSAMLYPMILLVVAGVSLTIILTVVIPEFKPLFADAGAKLPLATRIVMAIGDAVSAYWFPALIFLAALVVAGERVLRRSGIRLAVDRRLLRLPLLGSLIKKIEVARFARTLGTLLENGIPLPTALGITHRGFGNAALANAIQDVSKSLKEGEGLAGPLEATKLFPRASLHLIRVGEETARLGDMLERLATILERDVQRDIQRALTLMVPLVTVVLGMMIAGIIASILVAILSLNDLAM